MPTKTKVFTFGYQPWTIYELKAKAKELQAIVVDIRQNPTSKLPSWMKSNLEQELNDWYIHLQELGNVAYGDRKADIIINDMETGITKLLAILETNSTILLCGCLDPETCHRTTIAKEVQKRTERPFTHIIHPSKQPKQKEGGQQLSLFNL